MDSTQQLLEPITTTLTIEWATITLNEGVDEAELIAASDVLQAEFVDRQPGFITRELLKGAEGQWIDLVHWRSRDDAEQVIANAMNSPACLAYFQLMACVDHSDPSAGVAHFEQVKSYAADSVAPGDAADAPVMIEWAPFFLAEGVDEARLIAAADALQVAFLSKQHGFIKRELLKGKDNQWVDLIYWSSREAMEQAMANVYESPACFAYFELMAGVDDSSPGAGVAHFERVKLYR